MKYNKIRYKKEMSKKCIDVHVEEEFFYCVYKREDLIIKSNSSIIYIF